ARLTRYGSSRRPGRPVRRCTAHPAVRDDPLKIKFNNQKQHPPAPPPNQQKHTIHPWETFSFVITFTTAELSDIFNLSMKQQLNRSVSITKIKFRKRGETQVLAYQ